jgi:hypothetical protein
LNAPQGGLTVMATALCRVGVDVFNTESAALHVSGVSDSKQVEAMF